MGEDIGVNEAKRFTTELDGRDPEDHGDCEPELRWDSPVYKFIERLTPPSISPAQAVENKLPVAAADTEASKSIRQTRLARSAATATPAHSELMQRVDEAQKKGDWLKARVLLEEIREMRRTGALETSAGQQVENPEDPDILQRLAFATYKSKYPTPEEALKAARDLLKLLEPQTTNDTETLGLWGSVHKRLWELTKESSYLDEAVRAYERGFYLRNDYYNGINYAYLLNERAAHPIGFAEAVADFVQARRVRKEVISICNQWLESNPRTAPLPPGSKFPEKRYWVLADSRRSANWIRGGSVGQQRLEEAFAAAPEQWMKETTQEQVTKLKALLAASPLKKLQVA